VAILSAQAKRHPVDDLAPCVSLAEVVRLRESVKDVRISDELKRYIVEIVSATRGAQGVQLGASPRASLSLMKVAQALAVFDGQPFVTPDHIQEIAAATIAHRLLLEPQAKFSGLTGRGVVDDILKKVPVPA
jgi:MoxR-like ATPase